MVRLTLVVLTLLICCGAGHAADERWVNFAEDSDLRYYLDQKSVRSLPDNVYLFWVKTTAKDSEFFKSQYQLPNIAYVMTNYELDCAVSSYRVRSTIAFDKNRREITKTVLSSTDTTYEPIQPETILEMAQEELCATSGKSADVKGAEEQAATAASAATPAPAAPVSSEPALPGDEIAPAEPPNPFEPAIPPAEKH